MDGIHLPQGGWTYGYVGCGYIWPVDSAIGALVESKTEKASLLGQYQHGAGSVLEKLDCIPVFPEYGDPLKESFVSRQTLFLC